MLQRRDHKAIKTWLIHQDMTQAQVARYAGLSGSTVCLTVRGHESNRRVLRALLELGCPASVLEPLPEDLRWTEQVRGDGQEGNRGMA